MIFYNFTDCPSSGRFYGGAAGAKLGITFQEHPWIVKFPNNIREFNRVEISYSTSPISEYLGSHIYELLGIDVHETLLGCYKDKVVVACKDFRGISEELIDFRSLKNEYMPEFYDKISSSGDSIVFDEILLTISNNSVFISHPELKNRFWDMFVVDAFIGNNDRNNGNWGILRNDLTGNVRIAPVYDNGSSFSNKLSDRQMDAILNNPYSFQQSAFESRTCVYTDNTGKKINPLKYIQSTNNKACLAAIRRITKRIDMTAIKQLIDDIPDHFNGFVVMSDTQKYLYYKVLEYRYENVLYPAYRQLNKNKSKSIPIS